MSIKKYLKRQVQMAQTELRATHWPAFITLTYAEQWLFQPRQISDFMQHLRKFIKRHDYHNRPVRYVWVAEMQKRGVVHYHIVVWVPRTIRKLPKPDCQGWWPWGMSNIQHAHSPAGYLAKYLGKSLTGLPPNIRRYAVQCAQITSMRWYRYPAWLRSLLSIGETAKYVPGKGWFVRGVYVPSPWLVNRYMEIVWCGWLDMDKVLQLDNAWRAYSVDSIRYSDRYKITVKRGFGKYCQLA